MIRIFLLTLLLTGCMVGPNYHAPQPPRVSAYTEAAVPQKIGDSALRQVFRPGSDIPAEWWYLFESAELNELIKIGLANSPNITLACAALKQAEEVLNAQMGSAFLPSVMAQGEGTRQRTVSTPTSSGSSPGFIFNVFNTRVNVGYTLDVFGGARREMEALQARVGYQRYELLAAQLTLASNIVTTAVTMASIQAQMEATHALIKAQEDQLGLMKKQFEYGAISLDVSLSQETLLAQTKATLPPLEKAYSQYYHALNVLIGAYPNARLPIIKLKKLKLPASLPISLPSHLVRQRPDILAAESLLQAANAEVGVATANLFPNIQLTAALGSQALTLNQLFKSHNGFWSLGTGITQPIFEGGSLWAKKRGAFDAYLQAGATYKQTVLQAFQNVADALRALEYDAKALKANQKAEQSAKKLLLLSKKQYQLGAVNYLALLNSEQQYQQTRIAVIQATAARYNDTAALFQALGGGWWNQKREILR